MWCAAALTLLGLMLGTSAFSAEESVATALVVSVDISGSVDETRYHLQMEGIAEALEDPTVLSAIQANSAEFISPW